MKNHVEDLYSNEFGSPLSVTLMISNLNAKCRHYAYDYSTTILQNELEDHFKKAYPDILVKEISVVNDTQEVAELVRKSMDGMFAGILKWLFSELEIPTRWYCIFLPENDAFYVNYMIQSLFIETAMDLIRFKEMYYYLKGLVFSKSQMERPSIQVKLAYPNFQYGTEYAKLSTKFSIIILYSLFSPLITIVGLPYFFLKCFVDQHNLSFAYDSSDDITRFINRCLTDFYQLPCY